MDTSFPAASPSLAAPAVAPIARRRPLLEALFDETAMTAYPVLARALGYRFEVGNSEKLAADGRSVVDAAWAAKGVVRPPDVAAFGARYDRGTTWIVCYRGKVPVGVMGLLDMRVASIALDVGAQLPPPGLDLATTREICRLAILPAHRGGAKTVMVGLLREMLHWSKQNGIALLFSGSTEKLFRVYERYNPTARLVEAPPDPVPNPARDRYYAPLRATAGPGVLYTFEVAGASPWNVFARFLTRRIRQKGSR